MSAITFVQSSKIISIIRDDRVPQSCELGSVLMEEEPDGSITLRVNEFSINAPLADLASLTGNTAADKIAYFGNTFIPGVKSGSITQLTAVGNSNAINVLGTRQATVTITTAGFGSALSLILQQSPDGVNFYPLSTLAIAGNGTLSPTVEGCYHSLRIRFDSSTGGTPAVDCSIVAV